MIELEFYDATSDPDEAFDLPGAGHVVCFGHCVRCGMTFAFDPDTQPSVSVHPKTRCHLRPDGTQVKPGDPDVVKEPLCDWCARFMRRAAGTPRPLNELFPIARVALIDLDAARRQQTSPR